MSNTCYICVTTMLQILLMSWLLQSLLILGFSKYLSSERFCVVNMMVTCEEVEAFHNFMIKCQPLNEPLSLGCDFYQCFLAFAPHLRRPGSLEGQKSDKCLSPVKVTSSVFLLKSKLLLQRMSFFITENIMERSPTFLAPGTSFVGQFFHGPGQGGMVPGRFKQLTFKLTSCCVPHS